MYDAVRVTWGGVYVHAAPWSVASQGNANVSHGCINLSPDNAGWYYDQVSIGDPDHHPGLTACRFLAVGEEATAVASG